MSGLSRACRRTLFALFAVCLLSCSLAEPFYLGGAYEAHPIYYRRFGFPTRPLKHGPTPKFDKDVKDRIRSFIDPFYVPTTPSYEDIKPYLHDYGIRPYHPSVMYPNIIGQTSAADGNSAQFNK